MTESPRKRKLSDKETLIVEEIMNLDFSLKIRFNLLLVLKKKRPAVYFYEGKEGVMRLIDTIRKKFPFFVVTVKPRNFSNVFISLKKLPLQKKNELNDHHIGRILGYDVPMETLFVKKGSIKYRKFATYILSKNDKKVAIIFSERVKYFNQINPQKLKDYNEVAKEIGYRVELEKSKLLVKV